MDARTKLKSSLTKKRDLIEVSFHNKSYRFLKERPEKNLTSEEYLQYQTLILFPPEARPATIVGILALGGFCLPIEIKHLVYH